MNLFSILLLNLGLASAFAEQGLAVRFTQDNKIDRIVLPHPALFVNSDQAPSLLLQPGPFTAEFSGWISVDLRAQYTFTAEANGNLELSINGKDILTAPGSTEPQVSKAVRLNKGTNSFLARFTSPTNGPAAMRIFWSSRNNAVPVPIPPAALSHTRDSELQQSLAIHRGIFLVREYRCLNCHASGTSRLSDAPDLADLGTRLNADWLAEWILNPSAHRTARMPQLFHGPDAARHAGAAAAYLCSGAKPADPPDAGRAAAAEGEKLFQELHCTSCHTPPGQSPAPDRISLDHAPRKFPSIADYLSNPQAHYPANPMPNFRLNSAEATALAAFLRKNAPKPATPSAPPDPLEKGKLLVESSGCLNCHSTVAGLQNRFSTFPFAELAKRNLHAGCLGDSADAGTAPRFTFAPGEKEDIRALLSQNAAPALNQSVPHEEAIRQVTTLRCAQCHQDSGMPAPLELGGKLRPEWAARFIAGDIPYKPRPWLKGRMPGFPAYAQSIARSLAALHGQPGATPPEAPPEPKLVETGAKLVSANGGFSCVACHAVRDFSTAQVVESPGINLAYSGERLLSSFFHRWVMNPLAIDPATKMPVYFDSEGRSQLTEFFDGDALQQIDAIWNYLRMGDKMPPPPAP